LGHVEIPFTDLLAVAVSIRVVQTDAGWTAYPSSILSRGRDALQAASVGDLTPAAAIELVQGSGIEWLQAHVDVERRGGESANGRGYRRPERHVQVARPETLYFELVAGHAREIQAACCGNAFAVLVYVDRIKDRVQVRLAVAVEIFETPEVDRYALARDVIRQVIDDTSFASGLLHTDPAVTVRVGDRHGLQPQLLADHLDQSGAKHVRRIPAFAAVLGNGGARTAIAIGSVVADRTGIDVAARHHLACAIGQEQTVELSSVAIDAVAFAELALR